MLSELNYNYYGIPTGDTFTNQNSQDIGDLVYMNIWGYYYNNPATWGKPLDDSVYLWKINPTASFATNAAFSISTGNILNIDVAYNNSFDDVPLAMSASDVSGIGSDYNKGFFPDPTNRLAYDDSRAGGYQHTALFYDIVYNAFCAVPQIAVYTFDGSDTFTARTLENLAAFINGDTSKRFVTYFRFDLYSGSNSDRVISEYFNESTFKTIAVPDILSDRPIPESCTLVKDAVGDTSAIPPHEPEWIDDKIYSPFATALRRDFSQNYTENSNNQYSIGFSQQYTPTQLRNGYGSYNGGRVTGQFFRCNTNIQEFDDVKYQWEVVIYDMTNKVFLSPGYDITSLSHNLRFMTRLRILDKKTSSTIGDAVANAIKHELAYIGFYFADNATKGQSAVLGSTGDGIGVYLPEKIGGVTTGCYFTGNDIKNVPYCDADSCEPFKYVPGEAEGDSGDLTTNHYTATIGGSTNLYCFTDTEFEYLMTWLNTTYSPTDETEFIQDFKGENPGDYIVSVKYFPFDLPYSGDAPVSVHVGKLDTGLMRVPLKKQIGGNSLYNLGSFLIEPPYVYNDFRIQYCKMLLYIPWCGYTELDPVIFAKSPDNTYHYLNVKLHVDYTTGSCMGLVYRDSQLIQTINGTCGIDIPLSAMNQGSYQNAIKQAEIALSNAETSRIMSFLGLAGSAVTTIGSGLTGNLPGLALGITGMIGSVGTIDNAYNKVESAQYTLDHTSVSVGQVSGASPLNNAYMDQTPILFIYRPAMLNGYNPSVYGHTVGYACSINGKLSDFSGLTVCNSWDLSGIECTAEEKAMISQYLSGGVIV